MNPIPGGLNISWKSDVTSKQEKYVVIYVRNDTGVPTSIETREPRVTLTDLYPGAGYEIKVYALSHGLLSEPHISFTAVYPNPVRNLTVERVVGSAVTLRWLPPLDSLLTGYVVRYRPYGPSSSSSSSDAKWTEVTDVPEPTHTLSGLTRGEQFEVEVNSVSHHVESTEPQSVRQAIDPPAVSGVEPLLAAESLTLRWPRPEGRVDRYHLKWYPLSNPEDTRIKVLPEESPSGSASSSSKDASAVSVLVPNLHPGVEYMFEITTEAHNLRSETVRLGVRTMPLITSDISTVNKQDLSTTITIRYTPTPLTRALFDTYRFVNAIFRSHFFQAMILHAHVPFHPPLTQFALSKSSAGTVRSPRPRIPPPKKKVCRLRPRRESFMSVFRELVETEMTRLFANKANEVFCRRVAAPIFVKI